MSTPIHDAHGSRHPQPVTGKAGKGSLRNRMRDKVEEVSSNISRLGISVRTTLNPNHRHDEEVSER
jgi:hypothetical protein